jgi:hypothetical protein
MPAPHRRPTVVVAVELADFNLTVVVSRQRVNSRRHFGGKAGWRQKAGTIQPTSPSGWESALRYRRQYRKA